jgi:hypothetical protein
MAGRTHKVTILGEELVQACERRFGNFCPHCEAEEREEPETLPFRPSVGTPAGWSEAVCEEV